MALFNRKNKNKDSQDEPEPTQKEKVKFSKRPASTCRMLLLLDRAKCSRYRVQTATFEGLAADIDAKGRTADSVYNRSDIRAYRRAHRLGQWKGHDYHLGLYSV
jgi:hypothetical protein